MFVEKEVVLRGYQTEMKQQTIEALQETPRVCLYGPTGSGKTEVGMALVQHFAAEDRRVTWLANRIELIGQTSRRFTDHGISHGVLQGEKKSDLFNRIQVASIQTINRRKFYPGTDIVIIDEAHGAIAQTYRSFIERTAAPVIGLTATPFSRGLGTVFQKLICTTSIRDLTKEGWLVKARYYAPDRPNLQGVKITAGDYNEAELGQRVDQPKLVGNIVDEWMQRAKGKTTIVFATNINHSQHIVAQFRFRGIAAEHIDCYTEEADRLAILGRLRSGVTTVVSNVAMLAEGFDLPAIECMVLARPTKSVIRYLQMVGRALRPADGKTHALILDHSATVEELGFADDDRPMVLDDGSRKERKKVEEKVKPPHVCPSCKWTFKRPVYPCPSCGFMPEKALNVDIAEGSLTELTAKQRKVSPEDKQAIFSALLGYAHKRGYKDGFVAHAYRDLCGVWPRGLNHVEGPMIPAVQGHLIHKRIKWAHARPNV